MMLNTLKSKPEVATRRTLHAPEAMCEAYHYATPVGFSRGMEVRLPAAKWVFVSGTASVGSDGKSLYPGDISAQTRRAFENARAVLQSAGVDWPDVVKVTVFLKDIARDYEAFNAGRMDYFRQIGLETYPASTCVEARLCRDELLVEMDLVAIAAEEEESEQEVL